MSQPLFTYEQLKNEKGVIRTKSLFYEYAYDDPQFAIFTIKDTDHQTSEGRPLMSLSKKFIELTVDDPTEVLFADKLFGSWEVWDKIRNSDKRIVAKLEKWRKESVIRRKSLAFQTLVNEIKTQGRGALASSKYLLEEPWKAKGGADGRKVRKESAETAQEAFERDGLKEDLKRLKDGGLMQ